MDKFKQHDTFAEEVTSSLKNIGYEIYDASYHLKMEETLQQKVKSIYTPTSMLFRGRRDLIALKDKDLVQVEIKAPRGQVRENIALELMQFLGHYMEYMMFKAETVYVYGDSFIYDQAYAVYIQELFNQVTCIVIPERETAPTQEYVEIAKRFFPDKKVIVSKKQGGSGDPFVLIPTSFVTSQQSMEDLFSKREKAH